MEGQGREGNRRPPSFCGSKSGSSLTTSSDEKYQSQSNITNTLFIPRILYNIPRQFTLVQSQYPTTTLVITGKMATSTNGHYSSPPSTASSSDPIRDSRLVRASVLDAALELGIGGPNSTVANWIFNNPVAEEDEEEVNIISYSVHRSD